MHQKSQLGITLDAIKTSTLVLLLAAGIITSGVLFYFLSKIDQGIVSTFETNQSIGVWDSMYFSIITVSSLGYGDYRPVGAGRAVAAIEVVYGLFFLAVIVSKLASERTSTLIKLVYASDTQRRLLDFIESTNDRNERLQKAIKDNDYYAASEISHTNKTAFSTYKHFVNYHLQYGDIGNEWDTKQLVRLIKATGDSTDLAHSIIRNMHTDSEIHLRIENYLTKAETLSEHLKKHYTREKIESIHAHISKQRKAFKKAIDNCNNDFERLRGVTPYVLTTELLTRVKHSLPKRPWPDHVHKLVAKELKISNKLAQRAISDLLVGGYFPHQQPSEAHSQNELS
ncbi:two pore domain potassium channel family protein [Pseudomonas sp. TH08]|uniref:potassium channel family protein n=1 Tax=unclassified Pseudomonas TaxID=196821 RepID=UPI001911AE55|nr:MULTISPECIES: potassium channel family protein [unclassified Pseudomonas]MBK5530239.1 two pore domain potassium channel family protein [Pseudomonas sp. TH06]MBK5535091.1 two pore domain potassium channel family protein [Pseudomonas sp. TH08]